MAGPPAPSSAGAPASNPPVWTPMGPPTGHHMGGMGGMGTMMPMVSFFLRLLGFTLLFLGTLIAVAFANPGGGCFSTGSTACASGSSFATGAATAILTGQLLWAIGLFLVGAGSGLKIHYSLQAPAGGTPEAYKFVMWDRVFNGVVLLVAIWLLWLLLAGAPRLFGGI